VAVGPDQPHQGGTGAVKRVQRWFRGWHVVDGDVDRVLSQEGLEQMASAVVARVRCWTFEQQQVTPGTTADIEDAGALMGNLEVTKRRAVARTWPSTPAAPLGHCGAMWVGDPDL
jgi:hypothetical protein